MSAQADQEDWSRQRRQVFEVKEQALQAARADEHRRATSIIREAVERFQDAGIAPVALRARPYTGSGTIRTALQGWYLKQDRSLAVDAEGRYYVMRVDGGLRARLRGATPEPSMAPLVVGRGARDGDTFRLEELLEMRLEDPVRP
ncbi:hypothetical protein BH708_09450 [Brachybacterium sp. P6-10-X1]|uniref:hypothetical protein n=1 Tax=Brachybacterium sp. P6-10-X1 TaxID=1903186 RepID=UPI0009719518|nr:hypothetical protein [Brachybacterium sp. P6-10-X1]APX34770.1 hypothetical protein BH708_09450 [Brachybacterium sp. P6-10-X1]